MNSRQYYEDSIQRLVCALLPKMPPEDIRPAYQQNDLAGKSVLNTDSEYDYVPFSYSDNFIYIQVFLGQNTLPGFMSDAQDGEVTLGIRSKFVLYGPESSALALCLWTLLQSSTAIEYFERLGLYIAQYSEDISEFHEIVNEQWFERHEFELYLSTSENIVNPCKPSLGEHVDTMLIVDGLELK